MRLNVAKKQVKDQGWNRTIKLAFNVVAGSFISAALLTRNISLPIPPLDMTIGTNALFLLTAGATAVNALCLHTKYSREAEMERKKAKKKVKKKTTKKRPRGRPKGPKR